MKYLGNFYKKMIDPNWIDIIDKNSGQARPGTWNPINDIERAEFDKAKSTCKFVKFGLVNVTV